MNDYQAIIVGGGFFGCNIACFLRRWFSRILVIEREAALLSRASYVNQARVHNGYHYPRSYVTAFRSRVNFPRFVEEYCECVDSDFIKLYAIARQNSKVTARQFETFCTQIGAAWRPARKTLRQLFSPRLIEGVYEVEEIAFDAACLARRMEQRMAEAGVEVRRACAVAGLAEDPGGVRVALEDGAELRADRVFNCTYANLNHLSGARAAPAPLKYEITEVCLVDVPDELKNLGITVMDGPFFSVMPFPAKKLHSLTHVRYTPHAAWRGAPAPDEALADYPRISRFPYMLRDAARYLPAVAQSRLRESLFEVKTVLLANETDDGRPILFDKSGKRIFSVLGGKMDNIYDILEAIERELPCPN